MLIKTILTQWVTDKIGFPFLLPPVCIASFIRASSLPSISGIMLLAMGGAVGGMGDVWASWFIAWFRWVNQLIISINNDY